MYMYMYMCIYIYISMCVYVCVYIYIDIQRERERYIQQEFKDLATRPRSFITQVYYTIILYTRLD